VMASRYEDGNYGAFLVKHRDGGHLKILSSPGTDPDGYNWEHVSVSLENRCPRWEEMQWVRQQFWMPDEVVMQLHPAEEHYINRHPFTLHLWRHPDKPIPTPPTILV